MAHYDSICDLNNNKKTWRICVRISRKWTKKGYAKLPLSLELVMVDHEGAFIHGTVKSRLINEVDEKIVENEAYEVSYFKVESLDENAAICNNAFKIKFTDQTSVVPQPLGFPFVCIYRFKSFIDILKYGVDDDCCSLFDVIGHIVSVSRDAGNGNVEFILQDLEYISVGFLICPPFSKKERTFVEKGMSGSLNQEVVIIQLCRSNFYKGRVIIESYSNATKINFNPDSDSATTYRLSLSYRTYWAASRYLSHVNQIIPHNVVSISRLVRVKDLMTIWSVGRICDIVSKNNWFITVCDNCRFKRQVEHANFSCKWCNDSFPKNSKYKIIVTASDGISNVLICLLDNVVVEMLGMSACEAIKVPSSFLSLIGKVILFRVKIASCHLDGRETIYDVEDYSDDAYLLNLYNGLLNNN